MNLGLLLLRVVVGGLFIGHGTQKLFGWFGGHGPEGTGQFMASLGYRPGKRHALLAGVAEAGGGLLLVLGLLTPLAAAAIIGVMVNAVVAVHGEKGVWNQNGGAELHVVYSIAAATLVFVGPGSWSIDEAAGLALRGLVWGLATIAAGVIGGVIVSGFRTEEATAQEAPAERSGQRAA